MEAFALKPCVNRTTTMDAFENELSKLVGLDAVKVQLRALCLQGRQRKLPHFVFRGNRGTGKTMVGLLMGKLLHMVGIIPYDKVTVLQYTDFLIGLDGTLLATPQARQKIKEAEGGVLLVDDAHDYLEPSSEGENFTEEGENFTEEGENFTEGVEVETLIAEAEALLIDCVDAKEEILSFMDNGNGVVIFAGRTTPVRWGEAESFSTRVSVVSHFDDFSCEQLAKILHLKIQYGKNGYKLDPWCESVENVAALIEQQTTPEQRRHCNGYLVNDILYYAKENLACKIDPLLRKQMPIDREFALTITKQDLVIGVRELNW